MKGLIMLMIFGISRLYPPLALALLALLAGASLTAAQTSEEENTRCQEAQISVCIKGTSSWVPFSGVDEIKDKKACFLDIKTCDDGADVEQSLKNQLAQKKIYRCPSQSPGDNLQPTDCPPPDYPFILTGSITRTDSSGGGPSLTSSPTDLPGVANLRTGTGGERQSYDSGQRVSLQLERFLTPRFALGGRIAQVEIDGEGGTPNLDLFQAEVVGRFYTSREARTGFFLTFAVGPYFYDDGPTELGAGLGLGYDFELNERFSLELLGEHQFSGSDELELTHYGIGISYRF